MTKCTPAAVPTPISTILPTIQGKPAASAMAAIFCERASPDFMILILTMSTALY